MAGISPLELLAHGAPASTPALDEMWTTWSTITQAVDPWLDALTTGMLPQHVVRDGTSSEYIFG